MIHKQANTGAIVNKMDTLLSEAEAAFDVSDANEAPPPLQYDAYGEVLAQPQATQQPTQQSANVVPPTSTLILTPEQSREQIKSLLAQYASPVRYGRENPAPTPFGRSEPEHFDAAALKREADKPIDWAVKNLWTKQSKIILASEPKAGKTWLVCSMAIAICTGSLLFKSIEVSDPGPVGIIAAEDSEGEIGRRLDRMCRAGGHIMSNLDLHWWPGEKIRLNRPRDIDWIADQVQKYNIKLMIYDPLARLMDGDENSKECVSGVLTPASDMVRDLGCSVMIVHHLAKDDPDRPKTAAQRVRGSSDIRSWYSTGLFLSGQLDQGRVTLELEQRVRGKIPGEFPVRAIEVEQESVYGLGTIELVADISKNAGEDGNNEELVDNAVRKIFDLAKAKPFGITVSDIIVHLKIGASLRNSALKKLIREMGVLEFEKDPDIPDGKVLMLSRRRPIRAIDEWEGQKAAVTPISSRKGKSTQPPQPAPGTVPAQATLPAVNTELVVPTRVAPGSPLPSPPVYTMPVTSPAPPREPGDEQEQDVDTMYEDYADDYLDERVEDKIPEEMCEKVV